MLIKCSRPKWQRLQSYACCVIYIVEEIRKKNISFRSHISPTHCETKKNPLLCSYLGSYQADSCVCVCA